MWPLSFISKYIWECALKKKYVICFLAKSYKNKTLKFYFEKYQKKMFYSYFCMIWWENIYNIFLLFFRAHSHIYLLINDTWSHRCTLQYCKVRWCGLYHLLVGICENGYPLAHIPTGKWYSVYTIALYSTVKCNGVGCIIY